MPSLVGSEMCIRDRAFRKMLGMNQRKKTQELLIKLGYLGKEYQNTWGLWSEPSRQALQRFLLDRDIPPASTPQAQHYVMLQLAAHEMLK